MDPDLIQFVNDAGPTYGTENRAWFLYAITKMHRPGLAIELGTGLGTTAFAIAQAMKQNGMGRLFTFDDGSHWHTTRANPVVKAFGSHDQDPYRGFIAAMVGRFKLAGHLTFAERRLPPYPKPEKPIDLLFSDYRHDVPGLVDLFSAYLPLMSEASSMFIDSASTFHPAYMFLENLVDMLNRGRVPRFLIEASDDPEYLKNRRFTLVHLTEPAKSEQNSMAWLKIEPVDIIPYPRAPVRARGAEPPATAV